MAAGHIGQGLGLAGPQATGEIGDGGVGMEALLVQLHEANGPGIGIAMFLRAEQVTVRAGHVGTDEHGLSGLEDLIVGTDTDACEVLLAVGAVGVGSSLLESVVDGAQSERIVEEVAEQFADTAEGAMADQGQAENQLPQPGLGDGQPEQGLGLLVGACLEGLIEGVLGLT